MSVFKQFDSDKSQALNPSSPYKIPAYLRKVYHWAYLNPKHIKLLDNELVVSTILWGNHQRLTEALLEDIPKNSQVLQPACVYGNFSIKLSEHLAQDGQLDVIDIAQEQVTHCQQKLTHHTHAKVRLADAAEPLNQHYDIICVYFLLHELPDNYKLKVMNNLLSCLREGGKLIAIDYHKPHWAHPLKPLTSMIFNTLEPFAKSLWWHEIAHYVSDAECFNFEKTTYFGGLFQKVVITR